MTNNFIKYQLIRGYVHNWLVAGPVAFSLIGADPISMAGLPPCDLGLLSKHITDPHQCTWRYYATRDDHFIDLTPRTRFATDHCTWAYVQLHVAAATKVNLTLTTPGYAEFTLNGQKHTHLVKRGQSFLHQTELTSVLSNGANDFLVRFHHSTSARDPYVLALKIDSFSEQAPAIFLPTNIETRFLLQRQAVERLVDHACLKSYVFGYSDGDRHSRNQPITIHFPEQLSETEAITLRLESLTGDIFQELTKSIVPGDEVELAKTFPLRNGAHYVSLIPPAHLYYKNSLRFDRRELLYVVRSPSATLKSSDPLPRTQEALETASNQRFKSLFCEIAKISLGQWERVNHGVLGDAIAGARERTPKSIVEFMGLLGLWLRCDTQNNTNLEVHGEILADTARALEYLPADKLLKTGDNFLDHSSESLSLVLSTCEILAGQWLPNHNFTASGCTGDWHRAEGENRALVWLKQCACYGTKEWDSPASVEIVLAALAHLANLATSRMVSELASELMHKFLFSLAVNSFGGADGGSKGAADTASILSTRLAPTAGILRMLWGLGNYNEHIIGTVSIASNPSYRMPDILHKIIADPVGAIWHRARHRHPNPSPTGEPGSEWEVNTTTYKTKDFLLACAQDYHAGQSGHGEHIWQATLGQDAIVFVNHPVNFRENDALLPNLWAGNGSLPRATQWGDVLFAAYQLPPTDWLGFTHAYFPAVAFDQYVVDSNWAFARKGEGYLAITSSQGLTFITNGPTAFRELRSYGLHNTWICHMGQKLLDGTFEAFQHNCRAMDLQWLSDGVQIDTLRGERLNIGWQGPLLVNDIPQPVALPENWHMHNPYTTAYFSETQMDINFKEERLHLNFR